MMEDYADAAKRHFDDAKLLHSQMPGRLANASHLYGFAAECAIKCMMLARGNNGKVPKGSSGHLPLLLRELETHSMAKGNEAVLRRIKKSAIGLGQWNINQRYDEQSSFSAQIVGAEADSARKLRALSLQYLRGII